MKVFLVLFLATVVFCHSPEEGNLIEGDMEFTPHQMEALMEQYSKQNAFASIRYGLWKTGGKADRIKYYIDPRISGATNAIFYAMRDYQSHTCIRFTRYSSRPSGPHLFFTVGRGCSSPVGRLSYGNSIKLAQGCWRKGTIMHEIGHSLGLFHEQSRPDRDSYVTIMWNNIKSANKHNFNKMRSSHIDSRGTPYDFDSMMHYGSRYFTSNGQNTIVTRNSNNQNRIGQRSGFSAIDKVQINRMYC